MPVKNRITGCWEAWERADLPWKLKAWRGLAAGAAVLYGLGNGLQASAYGKGWLKQTVLPAPVIGVGNITAGGVGKTPLVAEIVRTLRSLDLPVGIISRGYGRQSKEAVTWVWRDGRMRASPREAGDEPYLLARQLAVPVAVGKERGLVGRAMLAHYGPLILVGDDLFQHYALARNLDLVVLDASRPLGNGCLLPRGPLREPPGALSRAQALILSRAYDQEQTRRTINRLRESWGAGPVLTCRHYLDGLSDRRGNPLTPQIWQGKRVLAFCGLARPDSFIRELERLGVLVAAEEFFPDHHNYTLNELQLLWNKARQLRVEALVTSEKDEVRLPDALPSDRDLWVTGLKLEFDQGPRALAQILIWGLGPWIASN